MSTMTLYQAINMETIKNWIGDTPIGEPDHFQVTDGYRVQDYYGSFQYDDSGVFAGTMNATTAYQNGLYFSVEGFSYSAPQMMFYIESGYIDQALSTMLSGDDIINGSSGDDVIKGYQGNDSLNGNAGNDTFIAGTGNDRIDGGSGIDTVNYANSKTTYTVTKTGSSFIVTDKSGPVDTLTNVERLHFGDGTQLALDVNAGENTGSAYRLYEAAFGRKADTSGLNFWTKNLDAGVSLTQIAEGFVASKEFKALNPGSDQSSIINSYYLNVLHRAADAPGLKFWSEAVENGMKPGELLVAFSESQENIHNAAAELANGVWLV